mmetsp:Transcript_26941/g.65430  ORF Transcript_26941/g.65430 Transcript_26941/m.65430 type:complete len:200 (-) Transcript_26941:231-830(-)
MDLEDLSIRVGRRSHPLLLHPAVRLQSRFPVVVVSVGVHQGVEPLRVQFHPRLLCHVERPDHLLVLRELLVPFEEPEVGVRVGVEALAAHQRDGVLRVVEPLRPHEGVHQSVVEGHVEGRVSPAPELRDEVHRGPPFTHHPQPEDLVRLGLQVELDVLQLHRFHEPDCNSPLLSSEAGVDRMVVILHCDILLAVPFHLR